MSSETYDAVGRLQTPKPRRRARIGYCNFKGHGVYFTKKERPAGDDA